ncbi:MAG TPA: hypothetical protein VHM91_24260 [Verrucomicrobiales bacterium]|nr:hypothetical protein [Verrucomicrobiales bacterium]
MKARALLRFLPACAAGLLSGWLASRWIPGSAQTDSTRVVSLPFAASSKSSDAAWRAFLASRTDAPDTDGTDPLAHLNRVEKELIRSPMRADILKEDYLLSLSAQAIVDLLGKNPDLTETERNAAFARLSELDPAMAFDAALRSGRERRQDFLQNIVCRAWLCADADAAFKTVKDMPPGLERAGWAWALAQSWATLAPAAAAQHLAELAALDSSRGKAMLPQLASTIVSEWLTQDFPAAKQWVENLKDPALRDTLEITLLKKQAETDPAAAVAAAFLRKNVTGVERDVIEMWSSLYHKDAPAAMDALSHLPPKHPLWNQVDSMAFGIFASRSSELAEKLPDLAARIPQGPQRDKFLAGFVNAGASNDVPFALKVLPLIGEGREREGAVGGLTEIWMRQDPVKTSEWLSSLPAGTNSRNNGVARFAENLAPDDPERAAQWASTLPDNFWQKENVVKTVLEKWRAKDPAAANAWQATLKAGR